MGASNTSTTPSPTALRLAAEGAHIVDVGGESTRPGAAPVDSTEECERVLPVVRALAAQGITVSIDTRHADTAERAMAAGARIINDVTGFVDPTLVRVAAATRARVVINHMPTDDPRTMQAHAQYDDVVAEVRDFLARRIDDCHRPASPTSSSTRASGSGRPPSTTSPCWPRSTTWPTCAGRCSSACRASGSSASCRAALQQPTDSAAASPPALAAVAHGASILRVHDVAAHVQALKVWHAIADAELT